MSEWQPIETAPEERDLLVTRIGTASSKKWRALRPTGQCVVARKGGGYQYWRTIPGNWQFDPTHWMPLPEPPRTDHETAAENETRK